MYFTCASKLVRKGDKTLWWRSKESILHPTSVCWQVANGGADQLRNNRAFSLPQPLICPADGELLTALSTWVLSSGGRALTSVMWLKTRLGRRWHNLHLPTYIISSLPSGLKMGLGEQKPAVSFPRPFFLGRDDKYSSCLMTVPHILWGEVLLSKGERHWWEAPRITISLSRVLVTIPGTGCPMSKPSTFPSTQCTALPALLPQHSQGGGLCGGTEACSILP